jgi:hypothetical protein
MADAVRVGVEKATTASNTGAIPQLSLDDLIKHNCSLQYRHRYHQKVLFPALFHYFPTAP